MNESHNFSQIINANNSNIALDNTNIRHDQVEDGVLTLSQLISLQGKIEANAGWVDKLNAGEKATTVSDIE